MTEPHVKISTACKDDGLVLTLCVHGAWVVVHMMHTCPGCQRYRSGNEKLLTQNENIFFPHGHSPAKWNQLTPPSDMHEQVH
jgi:uncharacterized membrane protein